MVDFTHGLDIGATDTIASPYRQRAGFSTCQIGSLFVVLLAAMAIPIVLAPWPPLADYINHLSRMHVIAAIGRDADLARFYEINWQPIPNLMMDLVVPLLERVMNVYVAGQVFIIGSFVLILSGTLALNRVLFGAWSALPLIAFPFLYNNIFLIGTMNYVFGIGLALWALVVWIALRERGVVLRLSVSLLFVLILYFCHLFSVGVYAVGLLSVETVPLFMLWRRRPSPSGDFVRRQCVPALADCVASALPFLPILPLLMASPTWGLRGTLHWELAGKLDGLIFVFEVYSQFAAFLMCAILAFAVGWAVRHRALRFHPLGWALLAIGLLIYLAMPRVLFDTFMADQRLPISLAFMLIACARLEPAIDHLRRGLVTILVLLVAIRVVEVQVAWSELSHGTASFRDSVRHIDRGSKVLVAYADPDAGDDVKDLGLVHAACLAVIERSALVTTAFTVEGKQILHVREDYRARVDTLDGTPPSIAQLLRVADAAAEQPESYWSRWTSDYDYVYALFTDATYENPDPARLTAIYVGERFVLFRVNPQIAKVGAARTAE